MPTRLTRDVVADDPFTREREEVERAAQHYYNTALQKGVDNRTKKFVFERCRPFMKGPRVLELGYIDGAWTALTVGDGHRVDIVEGASRHVEHAQKTLGTLPTVRVFHNLFQEYKPDCRYNTIVAGDMLRYLDDPQAFLQQCQGWLEDDGNLIVTVPNSRSLHRRVGTLMHLEPTPASANARDKEVGNRRGYDRYELRELVLSSGYEIQELHGCFLKPLSSAQMADWPDDVLRGLYEVGSELEDYCWFLYAIAHKRK